ncbi:MAG TPA: hypothetical protein VKZ74_02770 [Natronosporangium sp.]|nr:hypothetical protein [Natronosporangium sp.]
MTAALAGTLAVTGCGTEAAHRRAEPESAPQARTSPPAAAVTVLADETAGALALAVSQQLYDHAPVVVLAAEDDPDSQSLAADRARALGVPLLLTPAAGDDRAGDEGGDEGGDGGQGADGEAIRSELARLATETVLSVGAAAQRWAERAAGPEVVPDDGADAAPTPPAVSPPAPLATLTVLSDGEPHTRAAAATAAASGARVLVTSATDPRADPELITALATDPPTHTLALGARFGPADRLERRLAVAMTGVQLPGGGQVLFPGRRIVALYGHPGDAVLGSLGEQSRSATITRAEQVAAAYQPLVDEPVVPALEIITTIASASPGPLGDYSRRTPVSELRGWVDAAAEAGLYVVLDLQPGHTDFLTQAKEYEELLVEPHVGLALDPEWRLAPGQRHMVNIGSVAADEVNQVVAWLADLTAEHRLPQKLLILHQFQLRMITDRVSVDTGRDEVAVLIHADGFGTRGQKLDTWQALHTDPPPGVWWGWKNFYDEDQPTFTPDQTVAVEPSPVFISYQ